MIFTLVNISFIFSIFVFKGEDCITDGSDHPSIPYIISKAGKINDEMRMIYITPTKPNNKIKLDPLDPEDLNIDLQVVRTWSPDNLQLYNLLIQNGMAQFICNRQFLQSFYSHLQFMYSGISSINSQTLKLRNLKILNLFHNKISTIENIPPSCIELYLDFNQISAVQISKYEQCNVQLLSISHNMLTDTEVRKLCSKMKSLRCLNVASNRILDIRKFGESVKMCPKIKILTAKDNPICMLAIYWDYLTTEIPLDFFDNEKYVKPEPPKPPKKQDKPVEKKQQKKDTKKDTKKGGKVEQKPPQPEPEPEPVVQQKPRVFTEEDFTISRLNLSVGVLENFTGNSYDISLFPSEGTQAWHTQACFWAEIEYLGKKQSFQKNKIPLESATLDEQGNLLNFEIALNEQFNISLNNLLKINQGVTISIWKEEPKVNTDAETGDQKVDLDGQGKTQFIRQCIGGCYINIEQILSKRVKEVNKNFNLFVQETFKSPLFRKPYENEQQMIQKNRIQFDAKLAEEEEKKRKEKQEEEAAKAQKKGGKDSKKGADKKGAKKDSKDAGGDKKLVQKSKLQKDGKEYCYLGGGKMYKSKPEVIEVKLKIG